MNDNKFVVSSSPHIHSPESIERIMWTVTLCLVPATLVAIYNFRLNAISTLIFTIISTIGFEALWQYIMKNPIRIKDGSAFLTGLLLALNLPPSSPWWMCLIGGFIAVVIAKGVFGGLGHNIFNPALTARVFLLISFPVLMTQWQIPQSLSPDLNSSNLPEGVRYFGQLRYWGNDGTLFSVQQLGSEAMKKVDVITSASPLGILKEQGLASITNFSFWDAFLGTGVNGSMGEVSALALLLGGLFLIYKKYITWHIPVSFLGTIAIMAEITHLINAQKYAGMGFHLVVGGAMIGAFFMATDYVTSPLYNKGKIIFGIGCGLLTMIIRLWGGYPEGVSFAILIMNAVVPMIDRYTKPKKFGWIKITEPQKV